MKRMKWKSINAANCRSYFNLEQLVGKIKENHSHPGTACMGSILLISSFVCPFHRDRTITY